jgi:hypothetical protein
MLGLRVGRPGAEDPDYFPAPEPGRQLPGLGQLPRVKAALSLGLSLKPLAQLFLGLRPDFHDGGPACLLAFKAASTMPSHRSPDEDMDSDGGRGTDLVRLAGS